MQHVAAEMHRMHESVLAVLLILSYKFRPGPLSYKFRPGPASSACKTTRCY